MELEIITENMAAASLKVEPCGVAAEGLGADLGIVYAFPSITFFQNIFERLL